MCGIFGYFDRGKRSLPESVLHSMGHALNHRGPDDHGLFTTPGVGIGNQRLSIIDLEQGHQPFVSENGNIAVVQNEEIYNYVELARELADAGLPCKTHSDTEVLLRLYQLHGIDFIQKLNGMFAIAIYDRELDALFLVRDRIGVKPLYLHDDGKRIVFASEIKALLEAGIPREPNLEALDHFLTYNYIPPPFTAFNNVQHLMPGTWMRIDRHRIQKVTWWDLSKMQAEEKSQADWIDEFNAVLDDAVRLRLRSDVPFGAFLSGGVDSSTIVGLMAHNMKEPANTFCIGFHEEAFDESPYAQEAAERFGTRHIMERVDPNMLDLWPLAVFHCDQPHGDISFLPTYRVSELATRHVKVVLTGDGGDKLFAGYTKYRDFFSDASMMDADLEIFRRAYYRNLSLFTDHQKPNLYSPQLRDRLRTNHSYDVVARLYDNVRHMDRINQALYLDMMLLLPGNNLVKPDRMGMAVSLEARTPFLDYRMMELAFRMPGALKLQNGETKYLFKKAVTPLIGENLAYRKKQMFTVPVGEWFRKEMAEFPRELLSSKRFIERGLFEPETVLDLVTRHRSGEANHTRELRALIAIELWFRIFIDGDYQRPPRLAELCDDLFFFQTFNT
ncbi:asparagine synthase (glutamine-hydrolyzing) [Nitrospina watsonii]|uniref:asparagine synthase (glutamine-hydrolyzing) n=1 Tax=Nitrospina watsonii TaxID=1323948 RepID=A0ABM9HA29_9BACT|nr:asparagine synthase (glutamine-hydrolyzing) [Nitrospina watsonii]CAI2716965.1 Asparagine synthetase (glutamine-hydrolyzing) [Nitrospina watsonii]